MTLVKRIAEALAKSDGFDPEYRIEGPDRRPTEVKISEHPMYLKYARIAVEQFRLPTKEMVIAGNDAARDHMEMDGYESTGFYPVAEPGLAVATINAMIDEGLKETDG